VQYKPNTTNSPVRSGNDRYEGFLIDLIEMIAKEIKFEYELYEPPDKSYGSVNEHGVWNGMIQELIVGVCNASTDIMIKTYSQF